MEKQESPTKNYKGKSPRMCHTVGRSSQDVVSSGVHYTLTPRSKKGSGTGTEHAMQREIKLGSSNKKQGSGDSSEEGWRKIFNKL